MDLLKHGKQSPKNGGIFEENLARWAIGGLVAFVAAGWVEHRYFSWKSMYTRQGTEVRLRNCAVPNEKICPTLVIIPQNSEVKVSRQLKHYIAHDGTKITWRHVKYMSHQGWVNEKLLREYK